MGPRARRRWVRASALCWAALMVVGLALAGRPARSQSLGVVCSSIEDLCEEWAREFTRETGVRTQMVRMSSGEALGRLRRGEAEFDVWHGGTSDLYEVARAEHLLEPYRPPGAAAIPDALKAPDGSWTGVYRGMLGFCSNQKVLRELGVAPPQDWDDLLDPRLAQRVSLPDPRTSGTGYTMLWTLRQRLGGSAAALDWFERLRPNVLQYTTSGMAPSGVVGRGEAAVAITFTQHCVKAHDEGMDSLVVTYPRGQTGMEVGAVAVLRGARHPGLARRYVEHAVGLQAQQAGARTASRQLPTRRDAAVDPRLELPAGVRPLPVDGGEAARLRQELVAGFVRRVRP